MPAPTNSAEFIDLVRRSEVVEEDRLNSYLNRFKSAGLPTEIQRVAGQMVHDGVLTRFQAEQFLQGKYRRFHIGKYKVLEKIGSGGMGQVFLCEHKLMKRRVAVKVLPTSRVDNEGALRRFYREARAIAALDHPNIVRAFDIDKDESLHFLVMEFVDGASLHEIVKKQGPIDAVRAAHYLAQAAAGLDYAHQTAGLVHRDIKPGNIMLDRTGLIKILDMGLARFFNDQDDVLTHKYEDTTIGTADYLAPEQANDSHAADIRADIYGLGSTMYFVLAGHPPFPEGSVPQKLVWHQTKNPRPLLEIRPHLPNELVAIVEKMMRKDPNERYQTPAELMAALAPLTATPIPPPPTAEMPKLSVAASHAAGGAPTVARSTRGRATSVLRAAGVKQTAPSGALARNGAPASSGAIGIGQYVIPGRGAAPTSDALAVDPSDVREAASGNPFSRLLTSGESTASDRHVLESVYTTKSSTKTPLPTAAPAADPWAWIVGALAFVTVVGALGIWFWYFRAGQPI